MEPSISTYSFLDLSGAFVHPQLGAYTFDGKGVGSINVVMATDKTVHDVAADGSVMVSKMAGQNGVITIQCQQTSLLHKFLLGIYNALLLAGTDQWAQASIFMRNTTTGQSHMAVGVSPRKSADIPYQAQGQMVSWEMMAANIQSVPI